jgi:hypothetical protein
VWLAVDCVVPRPEFIADFCRQKGVGLSAAPLCKTTKCACEPLGLFGLVEMVIPTGVARCLRCGAVVFSGDILVRPPAAGREGRGWSAMPRLPPARRMPVPPAPEPPKFYAEYVLVVVPEETQEQQDSRKVFTAFLCARLRATNGVHSLEGPFGRWTQWDGTGVKYHPIPESTESYFK